MVMYTLKIIDIVEESENSKTYYLEKPEELTWEEGAHTHIALPWFQKGEERNKELVRHMSIMTLAEENKIGFTTRVKEEASLYKQELSKMSVGDELVLFKLGCHLQLRREERPLVLLSMGVAIAAMRPLIKAFVRNSDQISKLYNININKEEDYIYIDDLANDTELTDDLELIYVEDKTNYYEAIKEVSENVSPIYYIVGSDSFLTDNIEFLRSRGVKEEDIVLDKRADRRELFFN